MSALATAGSRVKARFYGWYVVLAAAAISFYSGGVWFYGFSVFFAAILKEFKWGRAVTSGAVSFSRLEGGIEAPIIGWLIDKVGPRKLALIGATLLGLGYLLLSRASSLWMFYLLYVGVLSIGYNTGVQGSGTAAVANWFVKKRGRAFALYSLGTGLGGAIIVPLLGVAVEHWGWRTTVVIAGVGVWLILLPLAMFLRHKPEQYGQYPDGASAPPEESADTEYGPADFTVVQALKTPSFWLLTFGTGLRAMAMTAVVLHQVVYLQGIGPDIGLSDARAAAALGLMALFSLPGRFGFGWLGDVIEKRYVMVMALVLQAIGIFILANINALWMVYLFVVVYGLGYGGTIPVQFALRAEYFGRRHYATISGVAQFVLMPFTVAGPVFAGWVYDVTGSYYWAFILFVATSLLGAVFIFFARRPRHPDAGTISARAVSTPPPAVMH